MVYWRGACGGKREVRTQGGSREEKKGGKEEEGVESPESWDLGGGNEVEDSCSFGSGTMREMERVVLNFINVWMESSGISS